MERKKIRNNHVYMLNDKLHLPVPNTKWSSQRIYGRMSQPIIIKLIDSQINGRYFPFFLNYCRFNWSIKAARGTPCCSNEISPPDVVPIK